jgi:outer membrane protein assembly factor BamB
VNGCASCRARSALRAWHRLRPEAGTDARLPHGDEGRYHRKRVAWSFDENRTPDVCTPAFYQGKLFALHGDPPAGPTLTCLDPRTGAKIWQGNLDERVVVRASPTVADGKVYIINEKGTVLSAVQGKFKILSKIPMGRQRGERARSIAVSRQCIHPHDGALYCVGK